jgi:hypothetical protein
MNLPSGSKILISAGIELSPPAIIIIIIIITMAIGAISA